MEERESAADDGALSWLYESAYDALVEALTPVSLLTRACSLIRNNVVSTRHIKKRNS